MSVCEGNGWQLVHHAPGRAAAARQAGADENRQGTPAPRGAALNRHQVAALKRQQSGQRQPAETLPAQASKQHMMVGKCGGYSQSNSMPAGGTRARVVANQHIKERCTCRQLQAPHCCLQCACCRLARGWRSAAAWHCWQPRPRSPYVRLLLVASAIPRRSLNSPITVSRGTWQGGRIG